MKKLLIIVALIGLAALALFIKDPNQQQAEALTSIYDNIIQKNADSAVAACQNMDAQIRQATPGKRSEAIDEAFKNLVTGWAAVQSTYIAGDLDEAALDYPQYYIDTFHVGKGDFSKKMARILKGSNDPKTALFSNQSKTIGALQIVLYQNDELNERQLALAPVIINHICDGLSKIDDTYKAHREDFISEPSKALSLLANALASQTFKTKDWRIGDPAGLTKKYADRPDPSRAEYHLSGLSLTAIGAIFDTQNQLIGEQEYPNFRQLAAFYDAEKQLTASQQLLTQAQQQTTELNQPGFDFDTEATRPLYDTTNDLQTSYYSNLIQALPVMAKILEADGD